MHKYDSMLCSCLFSSSNQNQILRVTFKKGLFGYQDVRTHNSASQCNPAHPAADGGGSQKRCHGEMVAST